MFEDYGLKAGVMIKSKRREALRIVADAGDGRSLREPPIVSFWGLSEALTPLCSLIT